MTRLPNYRPVPVRSGEFLKIMFMRTMVADMVVMVIIMVMVIAVVMVIIMVMVVVSFFGSCSLGPL